MLQGRPNNYDTDLFMPIITKAAQIARKDYVSDYKVLAKHADIREQVAAMRVVADHSRACAFLIADGVLPSNEGRGYVLRLILLSVFSTIHLDDIFTIIAILDCKQQMKVQY
jgi:alanyl-tRNA synthetase